MNNDNRRKLSSFSEVLKTKYQTLQRYEDQLIDILTEGNETELFYEESTNFEGLVSSGDILISWEEGASLALVGHPSSDGVTIKMPYGVMFYIDQLRTPSFPIGLVKTESGFIVRLVEAGLGR